MSGAAIVFAYRYFIFIGSSSQQNIIIERNKNCICLVHIRVSIYSCFSFLYI